MTYCPKCGEDHFMCKCNKRSKANVISAKPSEKYSCEHMTKNGSRCGFYKKFEIIRSPNPDHLHPKYVCITHYDERYRPNNWVDDYLRDQKIQRANEIHEAARYPQ